MRTNILKGVKISPRDKKIIIIGSIAAALILLVQFGILPFIENKKNVREELKNKKAEMQRYLQILEEKDDYKKTIQELNKRLEQANAKLLPESSPAPAKAKLEETLIDMASKAGVELSSRRQEREEKLNDEYQKVSMRIDQILCMPDQAMNFLYHIKTFKDYHLVIEQLDINPATYTHARVVGAKVDNRIRIGAKIAAIIRVTPEKKEETPRGKSIATQKVSLRNSEPYDGRKQS